MDIVDPRIDPRLVSPGSRALIIAENQTYVDSDGAEKAYRPLPSVRTPLHQVITRWAPTDDERMAILKGEDIYVTILAEGAINPLFVTVGPIDWTVQA